VKTNERLRRTILEVVDTQIRERNPPETKETFDRLVAAGVERDEARRLIGCVVACEIFDVLQSMQPFDGDRYVKALSMLPELPSSD
jgi:hypothetical protein